MGQKSMQGPCAVNIMESLLSLLARVLSPIYSSQTSGMVSPAGQLDLTLIGWILLFMSRNLDNAGGTGIGDSELGAAGGMGKKQTG
ncbi:hypothetical protein DPMN_095890 [Dreissena polymorpha]|uniref:Uncharacterized protein n=2 Tax=Dreissena polymorpha TaxID=45954 RepID=A0A9D4L8R9_DREPO|nr:hypothetical protein DPMN_095890 [Dreissena polymorpha]